MFGYRFAAANAARLMLDTCVLLTETLGPASGKGTRTITWEPGPAINCRFMGSGTQEGQASTTQVDTSSGTIWLPHGTVVNAQTRIRLTHRHGRAGVPESGIALPNPQLYVIEGEPLIEAYAIQATVRRATEVR